MFDIATITTTAAIALGILTWVALTRILGEADPGELNPMFGTPWAPAWPRGVQEEEPFHWHVERLDRLAPARSVSALQPVGGLAECEDCAEEAAAA
jgi:hypothetical protein